MTTPDVAIIGGGIVGLATGLELQDRLPGARIVVVEKEGAVASHQTGRNSGVIHAGVYYTSGSMKAKFCRDGAARLRAFCDRHDVRHETCGKLIVATDEAELPRMEALLGRAQTNGIRIERLDEGEARRLEPNIASVGALLSPDTGIVDYAEVAVTMARVFRAQGGSLLTGLRVTRAREDAAGIRLTTPRGEIHAAKAVFCAGLHADRMASAMGLRPDFRIVPFRGEYFALRNQPEDLVRHLIYPVPDPARPFLGVHLTRKLHGGLTVGPNAVMAMAREGYERSDLSLPDMTNAAIWPGFWRMSARNLGAGLGELAGSLSKAVYLRKVRRYCDRIEAGDLAPWRSGVRAQAVARDGRLIDDFLFMDGRHSVHVCNAPSPAATACMPIASHVADRLMGSV